MDSFDIGPLSIPAAYIFLVTSLLIAAGAGLWVGRRENARVGRLLGGMLLAGLVAGRIAFVAVWFELYRKAPLTMLDIRDGGFLWWAALGTALAFGAWKASRSRQLRNPLVAAVMAGFVAWFVSGAPAALRVSDDKAVPALTLTTLDGAAIALPALAKGRPTVINLWATWCPPCVREMPVLAAAQQRDQGITFIFANQGESAQSVSAFLRSHGLELDNVLLDPDSATAQAVGSSGMPTTLFFDAGGNLVDAHLGAVSEASLEEKLATLRPAPAHPQGAVHP